MKREFLAIALPLERSSMKKFSKENQARLKELEEYVEIAQKELEDFKIKTGLLCDHPEEFIQRTMAGQKCLKCDQIIG